LLSGAEASRSTHAPELFFLSHFCTHRTIVNSTIFLTQPVHFQSHPTAKSQFSIPALMPALSLSKGARKNNTQRYLNIIRSYLIAYLINLHIFITTTLNSFFTLQQTHVNLVFN
jgi:hypothetical protein